MSAIVLNLLLWSLARLNSVEMSPKPKILLFIEKEIGEIIYDLISKNSELEIVGVITNKSVDNWWASNKIWQEVNSQQKILLFESEFRLTNEALEKILNLEFDTVISIQYRWKIPQVILEACDTKVNLHLSPLPYYQGHNTFAHAILDGSKFFGVTLHELTSEFDQGRILYQELFLVSKEDTAFSLYEKSMDEGVQLVRKFLVELQGSRLFNMQEQIGGGNFFSKASLSTRLAEIRSQEHDKELVYRAMHFPKAQAYLSSLKKT